MLTKNLFIAGAVLGLLSFATPALHAYAATEPSSPPNPPTAELFTLRSALDRAMQASPELTAYTEESRAREAEIFQSSRWINPELSLEIANVAGSGPYRDFDAAETTLQLSQQLELGGKRQLRREAAGVEHQRSVYDLQVARIDVQARTARHFLTLLAAQEQLKLADEQIALAARTLSTVEEKIAVGKAPAVEKYRFLSALAEARLDKERAMLTVTTYRRTLADDLNLEATALGGVTGDLTILPSLPAYDEIETQIVQSPEIVRGQLESAARRRVLDLAKADRIVDPSINLGLRRFNESDENSLIFGLSLPLPLFDRNQGNVLAAGSRLAAAQAQEKNSLLQLHAILSESWQTLAAHCSEAKTLRDQIIPLAQQTFEAASYGYQSGKFAVLEVLDAQQSLIKVRERHLQVLTAAWLTAVELDRLLGLTPVSTIDQFTEK